MLGRAISNMMIKPGKSPVFEHPEGLAYESVEFQAEDGVTLRGWLIRGGGDRVIIQTHFGVQCSRAGYTPKGKGLVKMWKSDISFLRQARYLNERGYTVLMYDMRNHGENDAGSTPWVSWGPEEAKDVIAAVDFISTHPEFSEARIGLLSICMGAASTTYAYGMGDEGLARYDAVRAMIAVQPLNYTCFVKAFGIPGFFDRAGNRTSRKRLGFDLHSRSFISDVKHITVPTLVMQNENDPWTDPDFVRTFYDELQVEKELLWLDLSADRAAAYDALGTSPQVLGEFFDKHLGAGMGEE